MRYVEFLVFIGRLACEMYKNTKEERSLLLHQKIDTILDPLLDVMNSTKQFSFIKKDDPDLEDVSDVTQTGKIAKLKVPQ